MKRHLAVHDCGFTLVEVLVALVILLIGAYAALRLFPGGFAAIERGRLESTATRLADSEIQRWRLADAGLPEAIVWGDASSGALVYRTDYSPNDTTPNTDYPNWQPASVHLPRTVIGESLPVGDVTLDLGGGLSAIRVPLCRLRFGPLEHLYATPSDPNPSGKDPLIIYTTAYQRVDLVGMLTDAAEAQAAGEFHDWGRYYVDYDQGTISFDYVGLPANGGYDRTFRVEFAYLTSGAVATNPPSYQTVTTAQLVTVPAAYDSTSNGPGHTPISLLSGLSGAVGVQSASCTGTTVTITTTAAHGFPDNSVVRIAGVIPVGSSNFNGRFQITWLSSTQFSYDDPGAVDGDSGASGTAILEASFQGIVPRSERVHQAFAYDAPGDPVGPWTPAQGHFALDRHDVGGTYVLDDIGAPDARLLFHPGDAGRTVSVDYRVRDWQILLQEQQPDAAKEIRLAVSPAKSPEYVNAPRQPNPDKIIPSSSATVIAIDTQDGSLLDDSKLTVDYTNGVIANKTGATPAQLQPGHTYRVYYRAVMDWTVQPMKAATDYAVMVGAAVGYRTAGLGWDTTNNRPNRDLEFGQSELAKSIIANYYVYADPPDNTDPVAVVGELHRISDVGGRALATLDRAPAWSDVRVQGASMRARVLWAVRGQVRAAGTPPASPENDPNWNLSPERWRQLTMETLLRR